MCDGEVGEDRTNCRVSFSFELPFTSKFCAQKIHSSMAGAAVPRAYIPRETKLSGMAFPLNVMTVMMCNDPEPTSKASGMATLVTVKIRATITVIMKTVLTG